MTFRRVATWLLLAALPWIWFLARDRLGSVAEVVAVGLPALAVVIVAVAGLLGRRRRALLALACSTLLMAVVAVVLPWLPSDAGSVEPAGAVRVAGANVADQGGPGPALVALSPDVLVIEEMTDSLVAPLTAAYPHWARAHGNPD